MTPDEEKAQKIEADKKIEADAKVKADAEGMIPRERLNEEVAKRRALEEQIAKINADKTAAEKKDLESKQEYQKLYETEKARINDIESNAKQEKILNACKIEALKVGMRVDDIKLLDMTQLKVSDAGEVEGVEKAVKELVKAKPYLIDNAFITKVDTTKGGDTTDLVGEQKWKYLMTHGSEATKLMRENPAEYDRLKDQFAKK